MYVKNDVFLTVYCDHMAKFESFLLEIREQLVTKLI